MYSKEIHQKIQKILKIKFELKPQVFLFVTIPENINENIIIK